MTFYLIILTIVTLTFLIFLMVFLYKNFEFKKQQLYAINRKQIETHRYFEDIIVHLKDNTIGGEKITSVEIYDDRVIITM